MTRRYIENRKSFSGLTSEQLSSEDEIEMNDDRIALTLKLPVGEQSGIPSSSSGKPYLSLSLANLAEGDDKSHPVVDQRRGDPANHHFGFSSGAVSQREMTMPFAGQIQVNPFAYEALDTPVRQDCGGQVVCERDLAENCGVAKEMPASERSLVSEKNETLQSVKSHFLAIKAELRDDNQSVDGQASRAPQGLAPDARAGNVTEYCFMDVRTVASTDDSCPMLFGQKLSRRPVAEGPGEKHELPRQAAADKSPKRLAANVEAPKAPCSLPQDLPPPNPAPVAILEKKTSEKGKRDVPVKEPHVPEKKGVALNKEGREQPDSGAPKRVGRIIKLPASVVGSGPLEFVDRSEPSWNSKKRWRTAYDRESQERDHPRAKPVKERFCGSDGEEERVVRSRKHWREDDLSKHGRRVTSREFSPRNVPNDMYNLKISTSGPNRNVNRVAGPPQKETVFNRLNYGHYDDMVNVDREYRSRREIGYREDDHGTGRFHRSTTRSAFIGSSLRDYENYRPRGRTGGYSQRSLEKDVSRSPEKMNKVYTRAVSETRTPTRELETNATLLHSKVSGWDKVDDSKDADHLSSYVPFHDRIERRSCSPNRYVPERSKRMRYHSPSHQLRARSLREHPGSVNDERLNQRGPSHPSLVRQTETWEPSHGYNSLEHKQRQQRPIRVYTEEADARASGVSTHEEFEHKVLQDFLGPVKSYPTTSNPAGLEQTSLGMMEHMDRNEMNGNQKLVDYLGDFDGERRNSKLSSQMRDKGRMSTVSQNGYPGGSVTARSLEGVGSREVYDLNFGSDTQSVPRNKSVPGRVDHYWEERSLRQVSTGPRDIPSTDMWPDDRLELSINRYREKVCY